MSMVLDILATHKATGRTETLSLVHMDSCEALEILQNMLTEEEVIEMFEDDEEMADEHIDDKRAEISFEDLDEYIKIESLVSNSHRLYIFGGWALQQAFDDVENVFQEDDWDLLQAIMDFGYSIEGALEIYNREQYTLYRNTNLADVASEMVDEGLFGDVPESIKRYIDFEHLGRELEHDGYMYVEAVGGVLRVD